MKYIFVILFLFSSSIAFAIDKTQTLTKAQFEELSITSNGIVLNNFTIAEKKSWMTKGMINIEVSFSARNKTDVNRHFAIMLVGLDNNGKILWSMALEPMMSTLSQNKTETVQKSIYCEPGVLGKTQNIWYRVIGDF